MIIHKAPINGMSAMRYHHPLLFLSWKRFTVVAIEIHHIGIMRRYRSPLTIEAIVGENSPMKIRAGNARIVNKTTTKDTKMLSRKTSQNLLRDTLPSNENMVMELFLIIAEAIILSSVIASPCKYNVTKRITKNTRDLWSRVFLVLFMKLTLSFLADFATSDDEDI